MQQVFSVRCRNASCQKPLFGFDLKKGFCMVCRNHHYGKQDTVLCVLCSNPVDISRNKNNFTKFCASCLKSRVRVRVNKRNKQSDIRCIFRSGYCKLCKDKLIKNSKGFYPLFCSKKHRQTFMVYRHKGIVDRLIPFPCKNCGKITPKIKYSYALYCNKKCHGQYKYKVFRETHGN